MNSIELFITIGASLVIGAASFIIGYANYIWYVKLPDRVRDISTRKLGRHYLSVIVGVTALLSIHLGGVN